MVFDYFIYLTDIYFEKTLVQHWRFNQNKICQCSYDYILDLGDIKLANLYIKSQENVYFKN